MSHRLLPHTADLRASLTAVSPDELYDSAVALVREILVGESVVAAQLERHIPWDHADPAERFFRFVRELLYLYDAEGFLPCASRTGRDGVVVTGERFDVERHEPHHQVKALTRHGFVFEHDGDGYRSELVFDL